ncbi:hypothetical protein AYI69_g1023 [Smittium culicis]|uniref:Uncharacterized protein n=1 Tax=Smittium culicis TaxID=133412 RepID=A0A1R1YRJ8_9FUNG|nr:hypothetical protein AYI69_g10809 [Smittium culicis]OMJ29475.1 hypothetical protein AYI69_g1023 [Smittium culicis]
MKEEKPIFSDPKGQGMLSGITMSEPSSYQPIAKEIANCLSETGKTLIKSGYYDFSNLVIKSIEGSKKIPSIPGPNPSLENNDAGNTNVFQRPSAAELIRAIANIIPALRDGFKPQLSITDDVDSNKKNDITDSNVYFFGGCQRICLDFYKRFSAKHPDLFDFGDIELLNLIISDFDITQIQKECGPDFALFKKGGSGSADNQNSLSLQDFNLVRSFYSSL